MKITPAFTRSVHELFVRYQVDRTLAFQVAERIGSFVSLHGRIQVQMVFADGPVPPQAEIAAVHSSFESCLYCAVEMISESAQREELLRAALTQASFAEQWVWVGRMVHELHLLLGNWGMICLR